MKIGIDISQMAYQNTGVANFTQKLVENLLNIDTGNEYILFYSSLRRELNSSFINEISGSRVTLKKLRIPPTLLDLLWNRMHVMPIENFIGKVDIFISSDWTQPPVKTAKSATILYDLIIYKYPDEMDQKIITTHKRRLAWVKDECDIVFCISESTKRDAIEILGIEESRLRVIYPGE